MRKNLMMLAAVLCCALAFTACQKNNDTNTGNKENEETSDGIAKVDVFYKFMTTDDLLEYFDFKLEYLDVTNGSKLTENIAPYTEFKKEFGNVSLPLNMGYNVTATLKAGKTIDDVKAVEKMDYIAPFPTAWITMYKKDNTIWGQGGHSYNTSGATSLSGAKVAERYEKGSFNTSYYQSIDEKGSGTEGSWK